MDKQLVIYQSEKKLGPETKKAIENLVKMFAYIPTEGFGACEVNMELVEEEKAVESKNSFIQQWHKTRDIYKVNIWTGYNKYGFSIWKFLTLVAIDREMANRMRIPCSDEPFQQSFITANGELL